MPIVLVTGLGCSGKSTYATNHYDNRVIHTDALKFTAHWQRNPSFIQLLQDRIHTEQPVAIEGLFYDASDNRFENWIVDQIKTGQISTVVCFRPAGSALDQATRIMTRSFRRLTGTWSHNESGNIETPANVARLMEKTFMYYQTAVNKLLELEQLCNHHHIPFQWQDSPAIT